MPRSHTKKMADYRAKKAKAARQGGYARTQCPSGKIRFGKRGEAKRSLTSMPKLAAGEFSAEQIYRCVHCDGWHLTSQKREEHLARRRLFMTDRSQEHPAGEPPR